MTEAGLGNDEYAVAAGELNQTLIGLPFGYNLKGKTIYGRLGAVQIDGPEVTIFLDGIHSGEKIGGLVISSSEKLWFSHFTREAQVASGIERIEGLLKK